jgi:hypothetical protein
MTAKEVAGEMAQFAKAINKEQVKAVRRVLGRTRTKAINSFREHGIGNAIFGHDAKGARDLIKVQKVRFLGPDTVNTGLVAIGLAAFQETGGKTKPHTIKPKTAKRIAFIGRSGQLLTPKTVKHPGSRIARFPFLEQAVTANLPTILSEMDEALQKTANTIVK